MRVVLDTTVDALISVDREGRIIDWNLQAERILGWLRKEVIGRPLWDTILAPTFREKQEHRLSGVPSSGDGPGENRRIEVTAIRRDGHEFPAELTVSTAWIRNRRVFAVFLRDITERKLGERRSSVQYTVTRILSDANAIEDISELLLRTIGENMEWDMGVFWFLDQQARMLRPVEMWQRQEGRTEEFAAAVKEQSVLPDSGFPGRVWAQRDPVWVTEGAEDPHFPHAGVAAKVGLRTAFAFPISVGSTVYGVLGFFSRDSREPDQDLVEMGMDIGLKIGQFVEQKRAEAALKETEAQLRQSQKMEAIGRLAGGVAHDFNNLLTIINGYAQLLLSMLGPQDRMRSEIEEIKKAGSRAAALTRQLLAFSRRQAAAPQLLDLNAVVTNMEVMLRRMLGEDIIDLTTVQDSELGTISADPGQLDQVLMNLAVNARDAMPHGGRVTLVTANVTVKPDQARRKSDVEPGSYVLLSLADTGCGMDEETQAHLFEPFFTTKQKGTGLGLSTVYGIVKQNGGHIQVESAIEQGSTFKIYFPRLNRKVVEAEKSSPTQDSRQTGETILLVEDDPGVRGLVREMLKGRGYTVLEARDGINAQMVSKGHFGQIDLLLTDVVMPQKSGPETAKDMLVDRPGMKVLYMSGYPDHPVFSQGPLDSAKLLIQKPFAPEAMVQKVREVLDLSVQEFQDIHPVG